MSQHSQLRMEVLCPLDVTDEALGGRHQRCSAVLTDLGVAGGLVHHQVEGLQGAKGQEQVLDLQQGSRGRSAGMCMGKPLTSCSLGGPGAGLETCCCRPVLRGVRGQGIYMV